jgi:hypothetical protein
MSPPVGFQAFVANPDDLVSSYIHSGHVVQPIRWHSLPE